MQDFTQDRSDRPSTQVVFQTSPKRLGSYLVEAGLLSLDQINVILTDQQATGMRFGEIAVARGWLKEQTIEWIFEKVVVPERQTVPQVNPQAHPQAQQRVVSATYPSHASPSQPIDRQSPDQKSSNRQSLDRQTAPTTANSTATHSSSTSLPTTKSSARRDVPISKPLPSVNSTDNDVYWVG